MNKKIIIGACFMACAFASHANRQAYSSSNSVSKQADVISQIRAKNAEFLKITGGQIKVGVTERNKANMLRLLHAINGTTTGIDIDQAVDRGAVMLHSIRRGDMPAGELYTRYDLAGNGRKYMVMAVTADGSALPPSLDLGSGVHALGQYTPVASPAVTQYGSAPIIYPESPIADFLIYVIAIVYSNSGTQTEYLPADVDSFYVAGLP